MSNIPSTFSEVWYAYSINIDGLAVGTLKSFNPTQSRTTEAVREIATNGGHIREIVPGVTDYTVRLEKVRLYNETLFTSFGILANDIQNQVKAIDIMEEIHRPSDSISNRTASTAHDKTPINEEDIVYVNYQECWITDWGKTVATSAVTMVDTMTVKPTRIA